MLWCGYRQLAFKLDHTAHGHDLEKRLVRSGFEGLKTSAVVVCDMLFFLSALYLIFNGGIALVEAGSILLVARCWFFAFDIPSSLAPFRAVYRSFKLVSKFLLPIFVWAVIFANLGALCWPEEALREHPQPATAILLQTYFGSTSTSLKTVVQIMTFDSWTAVVDAFIAADKDPRFADPSYEPVCPPSFGVAWVYMVLVTFGMIFMNALTGAVVEAVATSIKVDEDEATKRMEAEGALRKTATVAQFLRRAKSGRVGAATGGEESAGAAPSAAAVEGAVRADSSTVGATGTPSHLLETLLALHRQTDARVTQLADQLQAMHKDLQLKQGASISS